MPFDYYVDVVQRIKETAPEIHIKAYTAVEIEWFLQDLRAGSWSNRSSKT